MMTIPDLKRLFDGAPRMSHPWAQVQFMPDAVAGGHDRFSVRVGKGFKSRLSNGRAIAFIKSPGKVVHHIGVEV